MCRARLTGSSPPMPRSPPSAAPGDAGNPGAGHRLGRRLELDLAGLEQCRRDGPGRGGSRAQFFAVGAQLMGGNGPIVSSGEVMIMSMRLGRLQRQSRRAFWASAGPEVSTSELAGWCWARQTLMERRALSRWQRESMIRAARSIGAVRARRIGHEWLWRLPDAVAAKSRSAV